MAEYNIDAGLQNIEWHEKAWGTDEQTWPDVVNKQVLDLVKEVVNTCSLTETARLSVCCSVIRELATTCTYFATYADNVTPQKAKRMHEQLCALQTALQTLPEVARVCDKKHTSEYSRTLATSLADLKTALLCISEASPNTRDLVATCKRHFADQEGFSPRRMRLVLLINGCTPFTVAAAELYRTSLREKLSWGADVLSNLAASKKAVLYIGLFCVCAYVLVFT
jgi:hypothetical protein